MTIPMVTWNRRMKPEGTNEYTWVPQDSEDIFKGKRVVLFALPGAFTPTCSSTHLPRYNALAKKFAKHGIDDIDSGLVGRASGD